MYTQSNESLPTMHSTTTSKRRVSKTRDKFNRVKNADAKLTAIETLDRLNVLEERMNEEMYRTDLDMRSRSVRAYQKLCSRIQDLKVDKTLQDRIDRAVSLSEQMSENLCNSIKSLKKRKNPIRRRRRAKSPFYFMARVRHNTHCPYLLIYIFYLHITTTKHHYYYLFVIILATFRCSTLI